MTWGRLMALALWTFAFLLFGMMFFGFAMMGDCYPGPDGAACLAAKRSAPMRIGIVELAVYLALTWLIFVRRWRKG